MGRLIGICHLVHDGRPVFSFDLGGGAAKIVASDRVDDGKVHKIMITRNDRLGSLQVDGKDIQHGKSKVRNHLDYSRCQKYPSFFFYLIPRVL